MAEAARQRVRRNQDLWDKIWRDKHGNIVIYQRPNIWLVVWVGLTVVSLFVPHGAAEAITWWLSLAALTVWAGLEVWRGVNYFRRALGALILVLIILAAFRLA